MATRLSDGAVLVPLGSKNRTDRGPSFLPDGPISLIRLAQHSLGKQDESLVGECRKTRAFALPRQR